MSYWQKKVVLVTGASRGLGQSLAAAFSASGARVAMASRNADSLDRAAGDLREKGADVLAVPADVTNTAQAESLVAQTVERYGQLDALINNAGRSARGEILATTPDDFRELLEVNLVGVVNCTRAAVPHLLPQAGHLVNIGSLAAKTAARYLAAYPASKFAVAAYSQQLRLELGPRGLHVLLVCPGPVARDDAQPRYETQAAGLPLAAQQPGGGAKVARIDPEKLSRKILRYCERRKPELVVPGRARLLFVAAQLSPRLGDWLVKKFT